MTKLYHRDVFIPDGIASSAAWIGRELIYSRHAIDEAGRDGLTFLPGHVPHDAKLVEIETIDGRVSKWLLRWHLDSQRDLVAAVKTDGVVKTVWVNDRFDRHRTLDTRKYSRQ